VLNKIIEAEQEQKADCTRIDAAVKIAQEQISALVDRCLSPDEAHKKWSAIRDQTILLVRDVRSNILTRATAAKETRRRMIETLFRDEGPSSSAGFGTMLADLPTKALLHHLRYLIRIGDHARAQQICAVFEARKDRQPYASDFEEVVAEWVLSETGDDLGGRLANVCRLAEEADAKLTSLLCSPGWRNRDPAPSSGEESEFALIGGDRQPAQNLTSGEFTLVPAVLPVREDELSSSIADNDRECGLEAETIESPPVSSEPLDALFAALVDVTKRD